MGSNMEVKCRTAIDGGSFVGVSVHQTERDCLRLGLIWVESTAISLEEFRRILDQQLVSCPPLYTFLTKHSWNISQHQEPHITLQSIISDDGNIDIRRQFGEPRVGVELDNGTPLGFVFIKLDKTLHELRVTVTEQLGSSLPSSGYSFLDTHGWPVSAAQEAVLWLMDVIHEDRVRIQVHKPQLSTAAAASSFSTFTNALANGGVGSSSSSGASSVISYKTPAPGSRLPIQQLTFRTVKDEARTVSMDTEELWASKQVLISYVRAEAAQHAVRLKTALVDRGFTVFLDVHEIKSGVDWQDSLNFAVSMCQAFVPLVTPRYGETQWTNREVKLADVLSKFILPVCFLHHWPPRSLAIQFATTQFVPWKPNLAINMASGGFHNSVEDDEDIRTWEDQHIDSVASQIAERIEENEITTATPTLHRKTSLRSCPVPLPEGYDQLSQCREGTPMVLVSAHPRQAVQCKELSEWLRDQGYEVWCSLDLLPQDELDAQFPSSQDSDKARSTKDDSGDLPCLSQLSSLSEDARPLEMQARQRRFQEKADEAGVVIFLLSKPFAASRTSQQQVFYCESRKRVIVVRCEEFCMPGWLSMLIGTGQCEKLWCSGFKKSLLRRVQQALDPGHQQCISTQEKERISQAAKDLKKQLPATVFVYISGGTKFYHAKSKQICKAIGEQLSELRGQGIRLATGGFYGVGQTVGEAYNQQCQQENGCTEGGDNDLSPVWHILPYRDEEDCSKQAQQMQDKTFSQLPYGRTLYCGNSVRDRETIVSRVFDICILIEGGPGAAHEAEQFVWNDRVVIPVPCTGGAAAGKFNVPKEVLQVMPHGVLKEDWNMLANKDATPETIGLSMKNIVATVLENLAAEKCSGKTESSAGVSPEFTRIKSPRRKRIKVANVHEEECKLSRKDTVILREKTD